MKVCLLLLAVLGVSYGAAVPAPGSRSLRDDFDSILILIPIAELKALGEEFLKTEDGERVAAYCRSEKFHSVIRVIGSYQEIKDFGHYLHGEGIEIIDLLNRIFALIGLPPIEISFAQTKSWREFFEQVKKLIPTDEIFAVVINLLGESESFQEFFLKIADSQDLCQRILAEPEVIQFGKDLREFGVDVDLILKTIKGFLGWD